MEVTTFSPVILTGKSGTSYQTVERHILPVEINGRMYAYEALMRNKFQAMAGSTAGYRSDEGDRCQTLEMSPKLDRYEWVIVSEHVRTARPLHVDTRQETVFLVPQEWDRRMRFMLLKDVRQFLKQ